MNPAPALLFASVFLLLFCTAVQAEHGNSTPRSSAASGFPKFPPLQLTYSELLDSDEHGIFRTVSSELFRKHSEPLGVLEMLQKLQEKDLWRCDDGNLLSVMDHFRSLIKEWPEEKRKQYKTLATTHADSVLTRAIETNAFDVVAEIAHRYPETPQEKRALAALMQHHLDSQDLIQAGLYADALLTRVKLEELTQNELRATYLALKAANVRNTLAPFPNWRFSDEKQLSDIKNRLQKDEFSRSWINAIELNSISLSHKGINLSHLWSNQKKRDQFLRLLRVAPITDLTQHLRSEFPSAHHLRDCDRFSFETLILSADPDTSVAVFEELSKRDAKDKTELVKQALTVKLEKGDVPTAFLSALVRKEDLYYSIVSTAIKSSDPNIIIWGLWNAAQEPKMHTSHARRVKDLLVHENKKIRKSASEVFVGIGKEASTLYREALLDPDKTVSENGMIGLANLVEEPLTEIELEKVGSFLDPGENYQPMLAMLVLERHGQKATKYSAKVITVLKQSKGDTYLQEVAINALDAIDPKSEAVADVIFQFLNNPTLDVVALNSLIIRAADNDKIRTKLNAAREKEKREPPKELP